MAQEYSLLIQAFIEEFGNSQDVILKINGRSGTKKVPKIAKHY